MIAEESQVPASRYPARTARSKSDGLQLRVFNYNPQDKEVAFEGHEAQVVQRIPTSPAVTT